jgi:hypothetical protein
MISLIKRKTKVYSSSAGNKILFNQIPRHNKVLLPKQGSQEEILRRLLTNKNCCSAGQHYLGCLGKKFIDQTSTEETTDTASLFAYIQDCRDFTRFKNGSELRQFVKEVYDKAEVSQSNRKTTMNYRLPILASSNRITLSTNKVCRKGIY